MAAALLLPLSGTYEIQLAAEASSDNAALEQKEANEENVAGPDATEDTLNSVCNESDIRVDEILQEQEERVAEGDFSKKDGLTYKDYSERPLEYRYPITDIPPGIRVTTLDIMQLMPVQGPPDTLYHFSCPTCCRVFTSGESLAAHVLQGIAGDFACRVFFQQAKLMKKRARVEAWKMYMSRFRAQSQRKRRAKRTRHEGDCDLEPPGQRAVYEVMLHAYRGSSSSSSSSSSSCHGSSCSSRKRNRDSDDSPPAKRRYSDFL